MQQLGLAEPFLKNVHEKQQCFQQKGLAGKINCFGW